MNKNENNFIKFKKTRMKRTATILGLSLLSISCSKTLEQQAQENIKVYLSKKLDDPRSYEAVSFGKLEKDRSSYKDDPKYLKLIKEELKTDSIANVSYQQAMTFTHKNTITSAIKTYKQVSVIRDVEIKDIKKFKKNYKPVDRFTIKHSFRAKNKMGALILDSCTVILDKQLSVTDIKS